jgi:hypothetical protein
VWYCSNAIGPHFCLTFLFLGILRRHWNGYYDFLDQRDSFTAFDLNQDGKLDRKEVGGVIACVLGSDANEKKSREECDRILESADVDNDGCVSFNEYPGLLDELRDLLIKRE